MHKNQQSKSYEPKLPWETHLAEWAARMSYTPPPAPAKGRDHLTKEMIAKKVDPTLYTNAGVKKHRCRGRRRS